MKSTSNTSADDGALALVGGWTGVDFVNSRPG